MCAALTVEGVATGFASVAGVNFCKGFKRAQVGFVNDR